MNEESLERGKERMTIDLEEFLLCLPMKGQPTCLAGKPFEC